MARTRPSFSAWRRWSIRFNILLGGLSVLALVGMFNYLAVRYYWRHNFDGQSSRTLSSLTRQLVGSITNKVEVKIYFDTSDTLHDAVRDLLREYELLNPRIDVQTVDYVSNPAAAKLVQSRFGLSGAVNKDLIIFNSGSNVEVVHASELSDYDTASVLTGKAREFRRTAFKGEERFSSALYSVISGERPRAYFVFGHGEHDPSNDASQEGYGKLRLLLEQNNIASDRLLLAGTNAIPADASLLIVPGPRAEMLPEEKQKLQSYLKQGGRLMLLFNSQGELAAASLADVLAPWGVRIGRGIVLDEPNSRTRMRDIIVTNLPPHATTRALVRNELYLHLLLPRIIEPDLGAGKGADAPQVESLAYTSPMAYTRHALRDGLWVETENDRKGLLSLAVAVEKGNIPGVDARHGTTRLLVVGDSMFLGNEMIDSLGNRDFARHCVEWLLSRRELLGGIGSRPVDEYTLVMTHSQFQELSWILLGAIPGGMMLLGFLVWVRRRY